MRSVILATLLGFLINTVFLFIITRRLMGVPVGWFRTLAVAVLLTAGMNGFMLVVGLELGMVTPQMELGPGVSAAEAGVVFTLIMAWGVALGIGLLVLLEAMVPTGSLPSPLAVLRDLPARRRRSGRYAQIVRIAVAHGLGGFLRAGSRLPDAGEVSVLGRRLRLAFSDAGVTFVKLGQMLATRPDVIGSGLADELGLLQADNPPEPWQEIEKVLAAELGPGWADAFAEVDRTPLAAASVGQVHRAVLRDGSPVVIKVQRPRAEAQTRADLDILLRMARWLQRTTAWGAALGVRSLAEGFAASLREELDYRVEAGNLTGVAASTQPGSAGATGGVRVPAAYPDLSTSRVLVMELVDGVPLSRPAAVEGLDDQERAGLAQELLSTVLTQVLGTGVFHADLHAGNVLLERPAGAPARLVLLDFGSVGRLDRTAREAMGRLLYAVDRGSSTAAVDALCEVLDPPAELDDRTLERELGAVISRVQTGAQGSAMTVFGDLFALVVAHGFTVPPQVAAAFRALGALEGTLRALDPGLDLVTAARGVGEQRLAEQLHPRELKGLLEEQLVQVLPVLQRLPRRIDAIAAAAQGGELQLRVSWLADPGDRAYLTGLVHHVVITALAAVLAVCGVLLLVDGGGHAITPALRVNTLLGATLFLFAFVLAARSLALVFRRQR